jgi:phage recombination protein Bet
MTENKETSLVAAINAEMKRELADPGATRALLATAFKGLDEGSMKQAIMEGMLRGFTFKDFLQKDVYAVPFGKGYSLVTSIDNSRKIAMATGKYAGKSKPEYEMSEDGKHIISCAMTVKRLVEGHICPFTSEVYFEEYTKKRDNWITKPRTMIAKVAEMHALRMAFPEKLGKQYVEEEMEQQTIKMRHEEVRDTAQDLSMGKYKVDENKNQKEESEPSDTAESGDEKDIEQLFDETEVKD